MRQALILVGIGALVILVGLWIINRNLISLRDTQNIEIDANRSDTINTMAEPFTFSSTAFEDNASIPSKYTCDADDVSPPLMWGGMPQGTQTFVLIVDDPDAGNRPWDHWVVFNIPSTTISIAEGADPSGTSGKNSWGRTGWGGPCPPTGTHRYSFRIYALDSILDLPQGATKQDIESAMAGHVLAQVEFVGNYKRQ